jgi:Helix-turn-helix domain
MEEVTTSQAARMYDTHPNVLNRLILLGRISARKNADGHWLISRESLENWNRQRVRRVPKPEQEAIAVGAGA